MAFSRKDLLSQANVPELGKAETSYPTPNKADRVVIERIPIAPNKYEPLPYHSPHPDYDNNGLFLVWQGKVKAENNQIAVVRVYANDEISNEDWYNASIKYSGDVITVPVYVRSYIELREDYTPAAQASTLTKVMRLKVTSEGVYTVPPIGVVFTPTSGGSGAAANIILNPAKTKVIALELTAEGTGYVTAPTISFTGGTGTAATATAEVQGATVYLVKEETTKLDSEDAHMASMFIKVHRVYETLPGPWIPFNRWDDNLGAIQGQRRAILTADPPTPADSTATSKTVYEARDGSAIVSFETREFWGDVPYDHEFSKDIPDPIPEEFRDLLPTRKTGQTEVGRAEEPELGPGELARTSREINKFWRHETVTDRDLTQLPITRTDYDLDGINAGGSEFGGVFATDRTLSAAPEGLPIEQGFLITQSEVKAHGNGLHTRKTKHLWDVSDAQLLLTYPGSGFSASPIVVFTPVAGGSGEDAAGTAVLSTVPINAVGTFTRNFVDYGDNKGVFYFLGESFNEGVWNNPASTNVVQITAASSPSYPVSEETLARLVDRQVTPEVIVRPIESGGGHYIAFDIGPGRKLKANRITIRQCSPMLPGNAMRNLRVEGFNDFITANTLGADVPIPQTAGEWSSGVLDDTVGYRFFRVFGTDPHVEGQPTQWPALLLSEIEFYGELTIISGVELNYNYDGDSLGVFDYLGALGNGGVWRNPHTNDDIDCAADALVSGTLDQLVDREASNIIQDGAVGRSYYFDLKSGRSLVCNKVSFRQRTTFGATAATVQLQGSNDPTFVTADWHPLANFVTPSARDTWKTVNMDVVDATSYRRFRLVSATANFAIGELELYGTLTFPGSPPTPTFSVASVTITDGGENYAAPPNVIFDGDGTGAAGTAVLDDHSVVSVLMTNHGTGYTTPPSVEFVAAGLGGTGAAATSIIDGEVIAVDVDDGGTGYDAAPDVVFGSGPGGLGHDAAAQAFLGFPLDTIDVIASGNGDYSSPPDVLIDPADATAHSILNYRLDSITLDDGGSGYGSPPTVVIDAPTGAGGLVQATAHSVLGTGPVTETLTRVSNGDVHGVLYRLGENFGAAAWTNPHTAGRCTFIRSSNGDISGSAAVSAMCDRAISYITTDNNAAEWFAVDLGLDRTLKVSDYTLQNGSTINFLNTPYNWKLQGSNDVATNDVTGVNAATWTDIDTHTTDATIPQSSGGWGLFSPGDTTAYRFLRIVTTGLNSQGNGSLQIGEMEFYGEFAYELAPADSIALVVIDDPGYGYLTAPAVSFTGSNTTPAAATAVLESTGYVDSVIVDDPGVFETDPDVTLDGDGTGATAAPTLENTGGIIRIELSDSGNDYQGAPAVSFDTNGGPGSGAAATATIEGAVVDFDITAGGTGYESAPAVMIGGNATATATITAGAVTGLTLTDGGSGYDEPPPVVFVPSGGPEGVATIAFGVNNINVTNGGSGYPVAPPVQIDGDGRSATAYSILKRSLSRVEVVNPGSGYNSTVFAFIDAINGDPAGATLTVQRSFGIESAAVSAGGSGYTSDPLVRAPAPSGGTDAIFQAIRGLPLSSVVMSNGGSGYTSAPTATFAAPFGAGTTATGDAILGFGVDEVSMDNMGIGYTSAPNVELRPTTGGGGATAVAELLGRVLDTIIVDLGGSGYTTPPTIVIGDGSNATAHAVLTGNAVTSIVIDDPGSGYTSAPAIFIGADGGGTGAHAFATLSADQEIRIVVTNPGDGYETAPDVIITLGGGSGAAATASLLPAGSVKRVELTDNGTNYIQDAIIAFSSGGGTGAAATGIRDLEAAGPIALIAVLQAGDGYVATTINLVISGGGGTGATGTATKKTLGSIKSVTVTNVGTGFTEPPIIIIAESPILLGTGAVARAILAATGKVKSVVVTSKGEGYTVAPVISFPSTEGSGAAATAFLTSTGSIETLTLTVPGGPFTIAPLVSFVPPGSVPLATALYILPQAYPTLIDELSDPTDKLVVVVTKDIKRYGTVRPPGYSEIQALNKYRSIQIVSKLDLHNWPRPDIYLTTQHVSLPNQLLAVTPVWSTRTAHSTSINGQHDHGDVSATAEISGSILVLKVGGFHGAAIARVERVFFNGVPPDSSVPAPTIIRPSTGTAFLKGGANALTQSGTPYGPVLNIHGQPAQPGDIIGYDAQGRPIYFAGQIIPRVETGSSASISSRLQIVDISDVLTPGINTSSVNGIVQEQGIPPLYVRAAVEGTFGVSIPASCPASLAPGSVILQEVGVEKRRFSVYTRSIIYVIVPGGCGPVGQYGPGT